MKYLFVMVFAGFQFVMPAVASIPPVPGSVQTREAPDDRAIDLIRAFDAISGTVNSHSTGDVGFGSPSLVTQTAAAPLLVLATTGRPDPSIAKARVQAMGDLAIRTLRRADVSKAERERDFRNLLRGNFQLHAIGMLALGRHRRSATPRQLEEFDRLFGEFVLVRCSELLDDYANEGFKVNDVISAGRKDVAVRSRIVPERGEPKEIYWIMREFNGRPQIIDVRVDNVSLVITQREEFNSVIQRGGISALLQRLRTQVSSHSAEGPT